MPQDGRTREKTLRDIINDILSEKPDREEVDELEDSMSLTNDLGLDSLDLAEMTVRIEDEYGVDVFEDEVIDEVGEVLTKIEP